MARTSFRLQSPGNDFFSDEELDADATGGITADILKARDDDESSLPKEVSHVNASSLLRHFFVQKPFIIETEELQVGPISDGYLANIEARQRRNQLQHDQTMTSQEVMTSQHTALQIQPTQTHIQPTITPVITPHVYVSKPLDQSNRPIRPIR